MDTPKTLNRIANFTLTLALLYAAVTLGQRWLIRDERVGLKPAAFTAVDAAGEEKSLTFTDGQSRVLVFWATWCGPCRVEMQRLQSAIKSGEIPADRVLAISAGEDAAVVQKTVHAHGYTFPVFSDPGNVSAELYRVRVTPTVFHIDGKGEIRFVSEGIHPLTVRLAKSHLNP